MQKSIPDSEERKSKCRKNGRSITMETLETGTEGVFAQAQR